MDLPIRKRTRLKGFDYSLPGAYFITICTKDKKCILSHINVGQGLAPAENYLTIYGTVANEQICSLESRFEGIKIDRFVIMPNHIHILISLNAPTAGASPCPTISDIICAFKSIVTRLCREKGLKEKTLFQSSFHDHVIRGDEDYQKSLRIHRHKCTKVGKRLLLQIENGCTTSVFLLFAKATGSFF